MLYVITVSAVALIACLAVQGMEGTLTPDDQRALDAYLGRTA